MLNSHFIYGPDKDAYDVSFAPLVSSNYYENLEPIPNATDFTNKADYVRALQEWGKSTGECFKDSILPVPVSLSYHYPSQPHIPVPGEKVGRFKVKTAQLYPENHLEMQKIAISGIQLSDSFSVLSPLREKIPIDYHISDNKYFSSTYIPMKPNPYSFASYDDYSKAMEKWLEISKKFVNDIPSPAEMGKKLSLVAPEEEDQFYRNKSPRKESHCCTYNSKRKNEFTIDPRLLKLKEPTEVNVSYKLFRLRSNSIKRRITSYQLEPEQSYFDLSTINFLSAEELRDRERHNFLYTMSNYNPSFIDPNQYLRALFMTLNHGCSRHYRFAVFTIVEGLLNRKNSDVSYLFKDSLELIYGFTALIEEFSSVKVTVYNPGEMIQDTNDDEMILNHAKSIFLQLSYNQAMLAHYETKKHAYKIAYENLSNRQTGLLMQANQLITYMSNRLLVAIKNCLCKKHAYCISLIVVLAIESNCSMIESFIINPVLSFFSVLIELNKCAPDVCKLLQKRILFSRAAATILLPKLFSIFSQQILKDIKENMYLIMKFITNMFSVDPRVLKTPAASFIPFYFAKLVSMIDNDSPDIVFQSISQFSTFVKNSMKLTPGQKKEDKIIVSESLKYIFLFIPFATNVNKKVYILKSIKALIFLPQASEYAENLKIENVKFLLQSATSAEVPVSLVGWKVVGRLVAEKRKLRNRIIHNSEVGPMLREACYRPSDSCIFYVLSMLSEAMTKERNITVDVLLKALNTPIQQDFNDFKDIVIAPDVKIESLMRTLIAHKDATLVPMQYHVLYIFKQVLLAKDVNKKNQKRKKKK